MFTPFELIYSASIWQVIPQTFARESSLPTAGTTLTLVDCTGESWEVQSHSSFLTNSDPVITIHRRDWCVFSVHHFLEEGDVCVFELTDPECFTILVRIFRVVDIPKLPGQRYTVEDHYNIQEAGFWNPNLAPTLGFVSTLKESQTCSLTCINLYSWGHKLGPKWSFAPISALFLGF